jgi:micrococcal nuclease
MRHVFARLLPNLCLFFLLFTHLACLAKPVSIYGTVVRVVDGDTVALQDDNEAIQKIRLAGIDAPESRQPYGEQATVFLSARILGKRVHAVVYKRDRYRRLIGTVFLGAQDVNLTIIEAGLAWHYKRYASEQSARQAEAYELAEYKACLQTLGLWQDLKPVSPWDWRNQCGQNCKAR